MIRAKPGEFSVGNHRRGHDVCICHVGLSQQIPYIFCLSEKKRSNGRVMNLYLKKIVKKIEKIQSPFYELTVV
jgi:hypothetical protein